MFCKIRLLFLEKHTQKKGGVCYFIYYVNKFIVFNSSQNYNTKVNNILVFVPDVNV
jgi:hypothetical protein